MERMLENLLNGNLSDAILQAKRYSFKTILHFLIYDQEFVNSRAIKTATYLKFPCQATWNLYCRE